MFQYWMYYCGIQNPYIETLLHIDGSWPGAGGMSIVHTELLNL